MKTCQILFASILAILILSAFLLMNPKKESTEKPNIIFLMIDDCSAVEFSCYATEKHPSGNKTPVIDKLASQGMRFTTCWAAPLCMPARAMLMTGKYGSSTGVYGNRLNNTKDNHLQVHTPISKVLHDNGYNTAISGKWHLPGYAAQEEYGWDTYSLLGGYMTPYKKDIVWEGLWFSWSKASETFPDSAVIGKNNRKYPALYWNGCVIENGKLLPSDSTTYAPDLNQKFALDFVTQKRKKPFFLYYPMVLPHDPWFGAPDPKNPGQKTAPGFNSQIERVEYYVDELVTTLIQTGKYENTIIILTADNATLANGKGSCSELGVRVPLIVFGGAVKAKGLSDELVDFVDMYPTLLEMAHIDPAPENKFDGQSFQPLINETEYINKKYIFSFLDMQRTIRTKEYMMDGNGGIWKCDPSGNFLDFTPLEENDNTIKIRTQLMKYAEKYPLPSVDDYGEKRINNASKSEDYPSHHKTTLEAYKNQDDWMNSPLRKRE